MRLSSILPTLTATGMAMAAPTEKRQSGDFKGEMLAAHNFYRSQHGGSEQGVADLTWDDEPAKTAQGWSDKCEFKHNKSGYGENIAYHSAKAAPGTFVNMWGSERTKYNFDNGGFSSETGHFTQVVWKGTTAVGCGQTWCDGSKGNIKGLFVVCNYKAPGNSGDYKGNVLKQTKGSLTDVYEAGKQPEQPPKEPEQPPKEPEQPPKEPEQPPKEPEQPPKEPEQPPKEPEEPEDDCENEEGDPEWNQDGDQEGNQEWDWNNQDWQDQDWNHDDWNNKDWNNDWNNKDWSKYWNKE